MRVRPVFLRVPGKRMPLRGDKLRVRLPGVLSRAGSPSSGQERPGSSKSGYLFRGRHLLRDNSHMPEGNIDAHILESAEQYTARLVANVGDNDPIAVQREAAPTLAGLIDNIPEEALRRRPAPGKWSVCAILAHLAEDELSSSWRYREMIEHSGATLPGFDQDEWARLGDYDTWPAREAFEMFRLLREANLRMFARLTPEEWQRSGIHAERGRMTVESLARHMAGHDLNHIDQVRRLLGKT